MSLQFGGTAKISSTFTTTGCTAKRTRVELVHGELEGVRTDLAQLFGLPIEVKLPLEFLVQNRRRRKHMVIPCFIQAFIFGEETPHVEDLSEGEVEVFGESDDSADLSQPQIQLALADVQEVEAFKVSYGRVQVHLQLPLTRRLPVTTPYQV